LQIDDGVADVGDLIEALEPFDDHVAHNAEKKPLRAPFLQRGLDLVDEVVYIIRRYRALGAGDANAFQQFLAVELLARA